MNPETPPSAAHFASFTVGDWLVEPRACLLSRQGTSVRLRPQLVELLTCLAKRRGEIVLKEEILAEVWPGQYIAESGLSRCIAELRQILQDDAQQPRFIETIPKRGYRLVAPVAAQLEPVAVVARAAGGDHGAPSESSPGQAVAAGPPAARRRRMLAALAVVVAVGLAALFLTRRPAAVVTVKDTVLLADVKNVTGDTVFDEALRLALAVNLEQAPFLRILPQEAVRAALVRSGRSPDEPIVGPVALDVCRREGAAVLLAASIASLGSRYAVGIEAVACESGESLGRALTEAGNKEGVLPALQATASRIRQRLGESRESLRQHDVPLVRATTSSLEALKALTLGDVRRDAGRHEEALPYYRQATELDPQFALAWARRGVTARNIGLREEAIPAVRRAFELVERVSLPERFFIEALYFRLVEGDPQKTIEIEQAWKRMYPGSSTPANSLASILADEMGQYEDALAEAREAIRLAPNTGMPYNNLIQACLGARRSAEAKEAMAEATRRGFDDWSLHLLMLVLALAEGDQEAINRETAWPIDDPTGALLRLQVRASAAAGDGRLREARRLWNEILGATDAGNGAAIPGAHVERADAEALLGDPVAARDAVRAAVSTGAAPLTLVRGAITLALVGDLARARVLLTDANRVAAADPAPLRIWVPTAEALIAARQGRAEDALRILQPVARFERGFDFGLVPLAVRGIACASARRPAEAAAAFADVVRLPAVGSAPWVAFARLGVARALGDSGDVARGLAAYDAFLESWKDADRDAPLLAVAQRERAALAAR